MTREHPGVTGDDVLLAFFILEDVVVCVRSFVEASGDVHPTGILLLLTNEDHGKQNGRKHDHDEKYFPVHLTSSI